MHRLLSFLIVYSNKTWGEILREKTGGGQRRKKHHDMEVSVLSKEARRRLTEIFTEEELPDSLFPFRLTGTTRLWGIRRRDILEFLWLDRDHQVYSVC